MPPPPPTPPRQYGIYEQQQQYQEDEYYNDEDYEASFDNVPADHQARSQSRQYNDNYNDQYNENQYTEDTHEYNMEDDGRGGIVYTSVAVNQNDFVKDEYRERTGVMVPYSNSNEQYNNYDVSRRTERNDNYNEHVTNQFEQYDNCDDPRSMRGENYATGNYEGYDNRMSTDNKQYDSNHYNNNYNTPNITSEDYNPSYQNNGYRANNRGFDKESLDPTLSSQLSFGQYLSEQHGVENVDYASSAASTTSSRPAQILPTATSTSDLSYQNIDNNGKRDKQVSFDLSQSASYPSSSPTLSSYKQQLQPPLSYQQQREQQRNHSQPSQLHSLSNVMYGRNPPNQSSFNSGMPIHEQNSYRIHNSTREQQQYDYDNNARNLSATVLSGTGSNNSKELMIVPNDNPRSQYYIPNFPNNLAPNHHYLPNTIPPTMPNPTYYQDRNSHGALIPVYERSFDTSEADSSMKRNQNPIKQVSFDESSLSSTSSPTNNRANTILRSQNNDNHQDMDPIAEHRFEMDVAEASLASFSHDDNDASLNQSPHPPHNHSPRGAVIPFRSRAMPQHSNTFSPHYNDNNDLGTVHSHSHSQNQSRSRSFHTGIHSDEYALIEKRRRKQRKRRKYGLSLLIMIILLLVIPLLLTYFFWYIPQRNKHQNIFGDENANNINNNNNNNNSNNSNGGQTQGPDLSSTSQLALDNMNDDFTMSSTTMPTTSISTQTKSGSNDIAFTISDMNRNNDDLFDDDFASTPLRAHMPSNAPSTHPSLIPTTHPSMTPTYSPSSHPSDAPSVVPSVLPSLTPSIQPSLLPSTTPSVLPTDVPSSNPSLTPTSKPSIVPTRLPSTSPSIPPTLYPTTTVPSNSPSIIPSLGPSVMPTTSFPTKVPSISPSASPTKFHSTIPSHSSVPSSFPTSRPTPTPQWVEISPRLHTAATAANAAATLANSNGTAPSTSTLSLGLYGLSNSLSSDGSRLAILHSHGISIYQWSPKVPTSSPTSFPTSKPTSTPTSTPTFFPTNNNDTSFEDWDDLLSELEPQPQSQTQPLSPTQTQTQTQSQTKSSSQSQPKGHQYWVKLGSDIHPNQILFDTGRTWDVVLTSNQLISATVTLSADGTDVLLDIALTDLGRVGIFRYVETNNEWAIRGQTGGYQKSPGGSEYGPSVAFAKRNKNRLLVGGWNGENARVFENNNMNWNQIGNFMEGFSPNMIQTFFGTNKDGPFFGASVAVSSDGTIAAVAAPLDGKNERGTVKVYELNLFTQAWQQRGSTIRGPLNSHFGILSMSGNGNRIAVGMPELGGVMIYEYSESSTSDWTLIGSMASESSTDKFGQMVTLSENGNVLAITAPISGLICVYKNVEQLWLRVRKCISIGNVGDRYLWYSVSLSSNGDRLSIGAPGVGVLVFELGQEISF